MNLQVDRNGKTIVDILHPVGPMTGSLILIGYPSPCNALLHQKFEYPFISFTQKILRKSPSYKGKLCSH